MENLKSDLYTAAKRDRHATVPAVLFPNRFHKVGFFPLVILGLLGTLPVTLWLAPSLQGFIIFAYCSTAVVFGCWCAYKYAKL